MWVASFQKNKRRSVLIEVMENKTRIKKRIAELLSLYYDNCFADWSSDDQQIVLSELERLTSSFKKTAEIFK